MLNSFRRPINLIFPPAFEMSINLNPSRTTNSNSCAAAAAVDRQRSSGVCVVASKKSRRRACVTLKRTIIQLALSGSGGERQMGQSAVNVINGGSQRQRTVGVPHRFSRVHHPQWASPAPRQSPQLLHWSHWATLTRSICMNAATCESIAGKSIHLSTDGTPTPSPTPSPLPPRGLITVEYLRFDGRDRRSASTPAGGH